MSSTMYIERIEINNLSKEGKQESSVFGVRAFDEDGSTFVTNISKEVLFGEPLDLIAYLHEQEYIRSCGEMEKMFAYVINHEDTTIQVGDESFTWEEVKAYLIRKG